MLLVKCDIINVLSLYLQGIETPNKKVKRFERSTLVARITPTRIDSVKKLSKLTKGQSINDVIQRKRLQSTRLTKLNERLAFPKQATSNVVASLDKVVSNLIEPFSLM